MKVYKKLLIMLIVIFLISIGAFAQDKLTSINVSQNSVNIIINGEDIKTDNFIYNGVTYVPLRVISENLNQDVNYDNTTKTITISTLNKKQNIPKNSQEDVFFTQTEEIKNGQPIIPISHKDLQKVEKQEKTSKDNSLTISYATPPDIKYKYDDLSKATPTFDKADISKNQNAEFLVDIEDLKLELDVYNSYSYSYGICGKLTNNSKYSLIYYKVTAKDKSTNDYVNAYQKFNHYLKPNKSEKIFTAGDYVLKKDRSTEEFLEDLEIYQVQYIAIDEFGNKIQILYNPKNNEYQTFK